MHGLRTPYASVAALLQFSFIFFLVGYSERLSVMSVGKLLSKSQFSNKKNPFIMNF